MWKWRERLGPGDASYLQERKRKLPKVDRPFPRSSKQSRVPRSPEFIATLGPRRLQTLTHCWLSSDQIGETSADFMQLRNTAFQSSSEQMLIGCTCFQREVGGASAVASDSGSLLRLMITITELAMLWSDRFIQKSSCFLAGFSQRQCHPAVYTVIWCLQSVTMT